MFRTCSVVTNLVTLLEFLFDLCHFVKPFKANYGTRPYSLIFTTIAALLQARLQGNTEPFRNGLLKKEEQDNINASKRCAARPDIRFSIKSWNPCSISFILIILLVFLLLCGNLWCFVYIFLLCRCENKHFDVHFWRIRLVLFPSKDGKVAAYEWGKRWKGVKFLPELASVVFIVIMIKALFPICTLTWHVNIYVYRQG